MPGHLLQWNCPDHEGPFALKQNKDQVFFKGNVRKDVRTLLPSSKQYTVQHYKRESAFLLLLDRWYARQRRVSDFFSATSWRRSGCKVKSRKCLTFAVSILLRKMDCWRTGWPIPLWITCCRGWSMHHFERLVIIFCRFRHLKSFAKSDKICPFCLSQFRIVVCLN